MFRGLTNFSYQRTLLQAFGWYLTFLLSIFVIAVVIGGSLEFLDIEPTFEGGLSRCTGRHRAVPHRPKHYAPMESTEKFHQCLACSSRRGEFGAVRSARRAHPVRGSDNTPLQHLAAGEESLRVILMT